MIITTDSTDACRQMVGDAHAALFAIPGCEAELLALELAYRFADARLGETRWDGFDGDAETYYLHLTQEPCDCFECLG